MFTDKQGGTSPPLPPTPYFIYSLYVTCAQWKGITHDVMGQISLTNIRPEAVASLPGKEQQAVKQPTGE